MNDANSLRQDLLRRAEVYVTGKEIEPHVYRSLGEVPTVLFRSYESEGKQRHGNFDDESFAKITDKPSWANRLEKQHPGKGRGSFQECDTANARELDSCTSSDALAMNIFCHPSTFKNEVLAKLFGFDQLPEPNFGFKAKLPFRSGGTEPRSTEIDLQFYSPNRTVIAECKLTETDFTAQSLKCVDRYANLAETFIIERLPQKDGNFLHYQLIRNVLAARYYKASFYLICDHRRPDLREAFDIVVSSIRDSNLKIRCLVITWQQIAATLPGSLQDFLKQKYGIA